MDECNNSRHKTPHIYLLTLIHNIHKTEIPDSPGRIHTGFSVPPPQESITIPLISHNQIYFIPYSILRSKIFHFYTFIIHFFVQLITYMITYLYVIHKYCHIHKCGGVLGYTTKDSTSKIPLRKSQMILLE